KSVTEPPANTNKTVVNPPDTVRQPRGVDEAWIKSVSAMPARQQLPLFIEKMRERNPGMRSRFDPRFGGGAILELAFDTDAVTDISPVHALTKLQELRCTGSAEGRGKLADLDPLRGTQLRSLFCGRNPQINDLSPLKGLALRKLS